MPHLNVLDLAVFPAMSKAHTDLHRQHPKSVAENERIWTTAQQTWDNLDSPKIARSFVLAYRIVQKVIDNNGNKVARWSASDFGETRTGIRPRRK